MKLLYFGCATSSGHYLHEGEWRSVSNWREIQPFGTSVDGAFPPRGPAPYKGEGAQEPEGRAALWHRDGWTIVAWWDNSIDGRPGSHSTFLAEGVYSYDEMIAEAQARYPSVMARQRAPIMRAVSR